MYLIAPPALLFSSNALLFISVFTRLPEIQAGLGIDKTTLGLALLGAPLGTFLALPIAGRLTDKLTPRIAAAASLAVYAVLTPVLALMPLVGFFLVLTAIGFVRTLLDVAENMVATGIERQSGVKVISRSHGFWSVGLFVGSLLSGWVAGLAVSPFAHFVIVSGVTLAATATVLWITEPDLSREIAEKGSRAPVFMLPDRPIVLIAIMVVGVGVVEGTIYDWGIFFIKERVTLDPTIGGLLYSCFTIGMGLTRLSGDRLREFYTPQQLIRASAILVAAALLLLLLADVVALTALALFLIGCGIALNMPIAIAATIALTGRRSPAENLAALSLTTMVSTLGIPPVFGYVADHYGIATSFGLLFPLILTSFLIAPWAIGRRSAHHRSGSGNQP